MQPSLSLITPSYNQAQFLTATLDSVLQQRDDLHEYFVFDGGSTDDSPQIIERYADQIDYWVSAPDEGQADAIEKGFARATGDIIGWLNSDDVLLPGAIAAVRRVFADHPETQAVTGEFCLIDQVSRLIRCQWIPQISQSLVRMGITRICQPTTFFRRDFYESIGGLDSSWHCVMDTELWYRMLRNDCQWRVLPRYLAARRYHDDMKGSTMIPQYAEERAKLAKIYPEYRPPEFKRRLGKLCHRVVEAANGRFWNSMLNTLRYRKQQLGDLNLNRPMRKAA